MISYYFDASYLGKLFWKEPGSPEVLEFASKADEIVCASHGRAEFYSIGIRKLRENLAHPEAIDVVFEQFNVDLLDGNIRLISCTDGTPKMRAKFRRVAEEYFPFRRDDDGW